MTKTLLQKTTAGIILSKHNPHRQGTVKGFFINRPVDSVEQIVQGTTR